MSDDRLSPTVLVFLFRSFRKGKRAVSTKISTQLDLEHRLLQDPLEFTRKLHVADAVLAGFLSGESPTFRLIPL